MKNLNLLVVFLIGFTFLSCSSDENNDVNTDPLIGIWKPIKEVYTYVDNSTTVDAYSTCDQMSRFSFQQDGSLKIEEFGIDQRTGICTQRIEPVLTNGSWDKNSNGEYRLITTYTYTGNGSSYTDDNPTTLSFTNKNNILKIEYADDAIFNGKQLKNHYTEFVRVQ